jgi:hypothetical protein
VQRNNSDSSLPFLFTIPMKQMVSLIFNEDIVDTQRRSGSLIERDSVGRGDQMSLVSVSLNRSQQYKSQH